MDDVLAFALERPLPDVPDEAPGLGAITPTSEAPAAHQ
jgi:hypothetical protein